MRIMGIFFLCLICFKAPSQTTLNVKLFGAKGDGQTDDTQALTNGINAGIKSDRIIEIPPGTYKITSEIHVYSNKVTPITIRGVIKNGKKPVIFSDNFINLLIVQGDAYTPQGAVSISNIEFKGNNVPYSSEHPYFNKPNLYRIGIGVFSKRKVEIKNCTIRNVYGRGIQIINDNWGNAKLESRFDNVDIINNEILNTWGLHPTDHNGVYDEYGDGIYVSNARKGLIKGNKVVNNLNVTKQFGRGGIVLEYNTENFSIDSNLIQGYDRNIHLEADLGNITIKKNTIIGSDFGILVIEFCNTAGNPITIYNNYISNENIPNIPGLQYVRNMDERALISVETRGGNCRAYSKLSFNKMFITKKSGRINSKMMRILENNLFFDGNIYKTDISDPTKRPIILYPNRVENISNETYYYMQIRFPEKGVMQMGKKVNNKLINSISNIPL